MTQNESNQFAAVFILQISVSKDSRILTRFETYLLAAHTPDEAHRQAVEFWPRLDDRYRNSDGEIVTIKCLGIHEMDRVEPDGKDHRGLISSASFVTSNGIEPSAFVSERDDLACFNLYRERPDFPNLDQ